MDRDALVIRHVAFEDLGVLEPLLRARGYGIRDLRAGVDPLEAEEVAGADLLVVLGGPIGVGDQQRYPFLSGELAAIGARLDEGGPTLGICLGAQLIAAALGAAVEPTGRVEIGYAPLTWTRAGRDSVLAGIGDTPVLHWHGDQFAIPAGAERLAGTPGFPNQAFTRGAEVLALQFHPEADHTRIEQWLIGHAHELASNGIDPQVLRDDARRYGPELASRARAVFGAWLDGLPA